jgi:hypothetical protein
MQALSTIEMFHHTLSELDSISSTSSKVPSASAARALIQAASQQVRHMFKETLRGRGPFEIHVNPECISFRPRLCPRTGTPTPIHHRSARSKILRSRRPNCRQRRARSPGSGSGGSEPGGDGGCADPDPPAPEGSPRLEHRGGIRAS